MFSNYFAIYFIFFFTCFQRDSELKVSCSIKDHERIPNLDLIVMVHTCSINTENINAKTTLLTSGAI